jgi:hypothetical protein
MNCRGEMQRIDLGGFSSRFGFPSAVPLDIMGETGGHEQIAPISLSEFHGGF